LTDNFVAHNIEPAEIRFTQSARKHRIGKGRALFVLESYQPMVVTDPKSGDQNLRWIGFDDRGLELEIIAVVTPEYLLVIHVMPYRFRRK
jgi:hypothetical protein